MKARYLSALAASLSMLAALGCATPPPPLKPQISSFSPSVGWAGTQPTDGDGTLVRIMGKGFAADPKKNEVFFHSQVKTAVLSSTPNEARCQFKLAFGGPGSGPGELDNPIGLAIDSSGRVYAANVSNENNSRIEVFTAAGVYHSQIGKSDLYLPWGVAVGPQDQIFVSEITEGGNGRVAVFSNTGSFISEKGAGKLKTPQGLAVDAKGNVYVADPGHPAVFKLDPGGGITQLKAPPGGTFQAPSGVTLDPVSDTLFVSDRSGQAIYVYKNDQAVATWDYSEKSTKCTELGFGTQQDGQAVSCFPWAIAADGQGNLIVDFGSGANLFKLDSQGQLISKSLPADFSPSGKLTSPVAIAVHPDQNIYVTDKVGQCVKIYEPSDAQELVVRVPAGAQTGKIVVGTPLGQAQSEYPFQVLTVGEPPKHIRTEITQGVWSYPMVTGKETLLWASLDDIFGHPARDRAEIRLTGPDGTVSNHSFAYRYDYKNKKTTATFHLPPRLIVDPGQYSFDVAFARDNKKLANWQEKKQFSHAQTLSLLFVKFTDLPDSQWGPKDPFAFFNLTAFMQGIETARRLYPVNNLVYHFAPGLYLDFIADGVQDPEKCGAQKTQVTVQKALNEFRDKSIFSVHRAIGLIDFKLNQTKNPPAAGWVCGINSQETAVTFFDSNVGNIATWGRTMAHEIAHTYSLVAADQPNFDQADFKQSKQHHSQNFTLEKEKDAPVTAWNHLTDQLLEDKQAYSVMKASGAGNDTSFFESLGPQGEDLEYQKLFKRLKNPGKSSFFAGSGDQTLVLLGVIGRDHSASIDQAFVTRTPMPLSPVAPSDYRLVLRDGRGRVIAKEGIALSAIQYQGGGSEAFETGLFNLVRPFPAGAARVEICFADEILAAVSWSQHAPVVRNVTVETAGLRPATIRWEAGDQDGDPLTYSVFFSTDQGRTFVPIAAGLDSTEFRFDHSLTCGSGQALVKVIAYDGLRQGQASSVRFILPEKPPQAAISAPLDQTRITEGSTILLRGCGLDAEDGILEGNQLSWWLDGTIELGSGSSLRIRDISRPSALGPLQMPLETGPHTITLKTMDRAENPAAAQVRIEVVADTDRDGWADAEEEAGDSDPHNPFLAP